MTAGASPADLANKRDPPAESLLKTGPKIAKSNILLGPPVPPRLPLPMFQQAPLLPTCVHKSIQMGPVFSITSALFFALEWYNYPIIMPLRTLWRNAKV